MAVRRDRRRHAAMSLAEQNITVTGRVLDDEGRPIAARRVRCGSDLRGQEAIGEETTTDARIQVRDARQSRTASSISTNPGGPRPLNWSEQPPHPACRRSNSGSERGIRSWAGSSTPTTNRSPKRRSLRTGWRKPAHSACGGLPGPAHRGQVPLGRGAQQERLMIDLGTLEYRRPGVVQAPSPARPRNAGRCARPLHVRNAGFPTPALSRADHGASPWSHTVHPWRNIQNVWWQDEQAAKETDGGSP